MRYNVFVRIPKQKTCLGRKGTDHEIIITYLHGHNGLRRDLFACRPKNEEHAKEVKKKSSITKEETEEEVKY